MANLQSQIDILAKAVVNEHVSITNAEGNITTMNGQISSIDGRITDAEGDISRMDERITYAEGQIFIMDGRITDAEEDIEESVNLIKGYGGNTTDAFKTIDNDDPSTINGYKLNGLNIVYTTNGDNVTLRQLKYNDANVGIFSHKDGTNERDEWAELSIYDPCNTLDLIGLNVEHIDITKTTDNTGIQTVSTSEYFIDVNGKISKIEGENTNTKAITDAETVIDYMLGKETDFGPVNTHINKVKDNQKNNQKIYAVNFIGKSKDCHNNNVQIQVITENKE